MIIREGIEEEKNLCNGKINLAFLSLVRVGERERERGQEKWRVRGYKLTLELNGRKLKLRLEEE